MSVERMELTAEDLFMSFACF